MNKMTYVGAVVMMVTSSLVWADEDCRDGHHCKPKTKETCFNLVCHYDLRERDRDHANDRDRDHTRHCTVASVFKKDVTRDGGEVRDDSDDKNNPTLEVTCDGMKIYNNSSRRSTDLLGTRIQGQTGPSPAILLSRGELHTGADGQSGGHYANSSLELDTGTEFERGSGQCFIWTGLPIL